MLLSELADELLGEVCSHLSGNDLTHFALCCRRLYSVAVPRLYACFDQTEQHADLRLARILTEPRLAGHVKHLIACQFYSGFPDLSRLSGEQNGQLQQILKEFLSKTSEMSGTDIYPLWIQALYKNKTQCWDAATAFLLIWFKNLQSLEIKDFGLDADSCPFIERIFLGAKGKNGQGCSILTRLTKMRLLCDNYCETMQLLPFLQHSSLRTVEIANPTLWGELEQSPIRQIINLNIFTRHWWAKHNIGRFLRCFHSLETFRYEQACEDLDELDVAYVARPLFDGLAHSKHSLREMTIIDKSQHEKYDGNWGNSGSALSDFPKLRTIHGDVRLLIGSPEPSADNIASDIYNSSQILNFAAKLPVSLKHLRITHCNRYIYGCMVQLLFVDKRVTLPRLKTLDVVFRDIEDPFIGSYRDRGLLNRDREAAVNSGITLALFTISSSELHCSHLALPLPLPL